MLKDQQIRRCGEISRRGDELRIVDADVRPAAQQVNQPTGNPGHVRDGEGAAFDSFGKAVLDCSARAGYLNRLGE